MDKPQSEKSTQKAIFARVTRKEWERVKFKAMLEGKKFCFQGNMWSERKDLLT